MVPLRAILEYLFPQRSLLCAVFSASENAPESTRGHQTFLQGHQ